MFLNYKGNSATCVKRIFNLHFTNVKRILNLVTHVLRNIRQLPYVIFSALKKNTLTRTCVKRTL